MFTNLLLAFGSAVLAQEAARLDPPLPVAAEPWPVEVHAYALPPQDPAWVQRYASHHVCHLHVILAPDGTVRTEEGACPDGMAPVCTKALAAWDLRPLPGSDPEDLAEPTRFASRWVLHYDATLGFLTLHVVLDPGHEAAFDGVRGAPGIKLVHPARPRKEVHTRRPRKARKAGIPPTRCPVTFSLDPEGEITDMELGPCPDLLRDRVRRAASRWKFHPRVEDGLLHADTCTGEVEAR